MKIEIEKLRARLQQQARIAKRAERALTLLDRGLGNRVKIARGFRAALMAGIEKFENEILGGDNADNLG
jgi:hypothetical protein